MPNGTSAAVTEAARLNEIGFPEFTAKLITDTFDALVSANIRQTEAYLELISQVAKTLTQFINDTKDDIGGEMILQFLAKVLPAPDEESGTKVKEGGTLTAPEATAITNAVAVPEEATNPTISDGPVDATKYNAILDAVARRIAADKYTMLKEMVKMGILRLVVENGVIETRLTFTTYGSTFYQKQTSNYHRDAFKFRAKAKTGSLISLWAKASASTSYTSVNVSTTKETNRDISGSRVQIYGRVEINFKTDYQPLT
jgi:hypothetical protein